MKLHPPPFLLAWGGESCFFLHSAEVIFNHICIGLKDLFTHKDINTYINGEVKVCLDIFNI